MLDNTPFKVDILVRGGSRDVSVGGLVVFVECLDIVLVPPGELGWEWWEQVVLSVVVCVVSSLSWFTMCMVVPWGIFGVVFESHCARCEGGMTRSTFPWSVLWCSGFSVLVGSWSGV